MKFLRSIALLVFAGGCYSESISASMTPVLELTPSTPNSYAYIPVSIGSSRQFIARIRPSLGADPVAPSSISWSSTSPAVASVDANGLVRGLTTGVVYIKAFTSYGNFTQYDSVHVTVGPQPPPPGSGLP